MADFGPELSHLLGFPDPSFTVKKKAMKKPIFDNVQRLVIINDQLKNDPIFFKKDQLRVGSVLKYYGRHKPNTTWEVKRIWYFHLYKGQLRSHRSNTVTKLDDAVEVVCVEDGTIMELTFQYLSYSAIWRLL